MPLMDEVDRTWKVGELARATGLTIRALHHYDDVGLLVPARAESGHRAYSRADVERLYRVLALRGVGMALDDIAAVLDDEGVSLMDTVRRHVAAVERDIEQRRRLLDRLRDMLDALEHSSEPTVDDFIGAVEAMTVVEATIDDIVTRDRWSAAWELNEPHVILLREIGGDRIVPIWIAEPEARALVVQRQGMPLPRPLGHDLMLTLLEAVDARIERIVIERLRDYTFFATVTVVSGGDPHEIDARPSDAINLAARAGAPIQIANEVIETAGLTAWPGPQEAPIGGNDPPPWMSLGQRRSHSRKLTYTVDEDAPTILRLAAAQAHELGHDFVGSAHLLLGILANEEDPDAALLLGDHRVTLEATRAAVAATLADAHDPTSPGDTICLTSPAMFAMHRASVESRRRGAADIAPMHLLLALIDSPGAADTLGLSDIDLSAVRDDASSKLDA